MTSRALVTGATSGIGRAFAVELARGGRPLVLVARDATRLDRLAGELPGDGHEVLVADLATAEGRAAVARRIDGDADPVGLLVNAAGVGAAGAFPDVPLEQEEQQLAVNVAAVMRLSWAAARAMRRRGGGAIVNVASTAAVWSVGTYAASKAWVVKATEGLAAALEHDPVAVLCVVPGFTRTEFHERSGVDNTGVRWWLWLTPEQVAREALAALEAGRSRCVPGVRYRLLLAGARLLPARARLAALRRLAPLSPAPAAVLRHTKSRERSEMGADRVKPNT